MPFKLGDVVLVPFPFTDQTRAKQRPAVVVSKQAYNDTRSDVVVLAISSVISPRDVAVADWRAAGLLRPSVFKPIFATLKQTMIGKRLGSLSTADLAALKKLIGDTIG